MNTTEIMKELIAKKIEFDETARKEKEEKINAEMLSFEETIRSYKDRIDAMIEVANYALANGITLYGKGWGGHEGYDTGMFFSNSWSHLLGFIKEDDGYIRKIGIIAGGACGNTNFYTDGEDIYGVERRNNYNTDKIEYIRVAPKYCDLKKCVEKFDAFEKEFYNYIEVVCTSAAPLKK